MRGPLSQPESLAVGRVSVFSCATAVAVRGDSCELDAAGSASGQLCDFAGGPVYCAYCASDAACVVSSGSSSVDGVSVASCARELGNKSLAVALSA